MLWRNSLPCEGTSGDASLARKGVVRSAGVTNFDKRLVSFGGCCPALRRDLRTLLTSFGLVSHMDGLRISFGIMDYQKLCHYSLRNSKALCIDLLPLLQEETARREGPYWWNIPHDGHFSEEGHVFVKSVLLKYLGREKTDS